MPEQVVITQELIDSYPYKYSGVMNKKLHKGVRCSLCLPPKPKGVQTRNYLSILIKQHRFHILRKDDEAVKVTFRNKTVAYYGLQCWNDPSNGDRVKRILSRELKPKIEPQKSISIEN